MSIYSIITGTGSYIPRQIIKNESFLNNDFYDTSGKKIETPNEEIIKKFYQITDIEERRYVEDDQVTSDLAHLSALEAIKEANIDKESIDYIIVAHNFGDIQKGSNRCDMVPSLASRVKAKLNIENPATLCFDIVSGCPGWIQGLIQADYFIRSGHVKRILVIGADTLSRISDPHDRDSMIYADGAGAAIIEGTESDTPVGILSHGTRSDTTKNTAYTLWLGKSNNPSVHGRDLYIKMHGHKIYEYALKKVPQLVKDTIEKANIPVQEVKKILIHQANAKMDEAILQRIFRLYKGVKPPEYIMPMTINKLGNTSVATVPTLLDLMLKNKIANYHAKRDDVIVFASVGAGMNVNSLVYRMT
ncbi:MAG: 3-oxoacyl-ACP synthase III family protein [Bacteroidota bacterium]